MEPSYEEGTLEHGMLDDEEFHSLGRVAYAMLDYKTMASAELRRWQSNIDRLSAEEIEMIPDVANKVKRAEDCIGRNASFLQSIVVAAEDSGIIGPALSAARHHAKTMRGAVSAMDRGKVEYVLKNLYRDWSEESQAERAESYGWVVTAAKEHVSPITDEPARILVPGCGLARLPLDLAAVGFHAIGNEFSFFMLLTSSFVLNNLTEAEAVAVHPWVLTTCNQRLDSDQLRPVLIPDQPAGALLSHSIKGQIGMVTGDFVDVFSAEEYSGHFDAVATCFFIDTAHNIIDYIRVIHRTLRAGGIWLNVGPLLYHWAREGGTVATEPSLELSLSHVLEVSRQLGFELVEQSEAPARYNADVRALYQTSYTAVRWIMRKGKYPQVLNRSARPFGLAGNETCTYRASLKAVSTASWRHTCAIIICIPR